MRLAKRAAVCSLNPVRFFASIVFVLMAVVLPMAGATHYFCTTNMGCEGDATQCLSGDDSCCGKLGENSQDCLIAKNILPDAEPTNLNKLILPQADFSVINRLIREEIPWIRVHQVSHEVEQVPDCPRRLYIDQRRLLI